MVLMKTFCDPVGPVEAVKVKNKAKGIGIKRREVQDDSSVISWEVSAFNLLCFPIGPEEHVLVVVNSETIRISKTSNKYGCPARSVHIGFLYLRRRTPISPEHETAIVEKNSMLKIATQSITYDIFTWTYFSEDSLNIKTKQNKVF